MKLPRIFLLKIDVLLLTQFIKFIILGSVNLIITLLIYFFLLKILKINYIISLIVIWAIGIYMTYIFNMIWVFRSEKKLDYKGKFGKYILVYLFSFLLNYLYQKLIIEFTHFDLFFAQMFYIPILVIINFLGIKFWVLSKK